MYSSQFDGNAAFSGGGFMPSQATQSAVSSASQANSRDSQGVVPLTVKQITEALQSSSDKSSFVVDGVDVNNVTIVGIVSNKVERVTDVGFVIDDGTGKIDVHRWVNEANDNKEVENVVDGKYVRVFAKLKGFQGKRQLVAFAFRPLTDFNELTFHYMECIYVHYYNTKMRQETTLPTEAQMPSSINNTPIRGNQGTQPNQFSAPQSLDQMVMEYLQLPANLDRDRGVHVDELVHRLNHSRDRIMASIKVLEDEALVYSTIDDEHFKSSVNA